MSRAGRVLMVQGTTSSAGKSLLVTGLCRLLRQDGYRVAPFKAQNMSNNSYVTPAGEEIGRAQAEQARAAGIEPDVRMNPVLLKPEADHRSQVVVMGRPAFHLSGAAYATRREHLWPVVTAALDGLRAEYDIVVIEGAGSPAEINLRDADIVNMRVARYAEAPVLLAGDIDRGGVFAHLYGTLALLEPEERALVCGLVINKFRGSLALLEPGLRMVEQLTRVPVAGVVPYLSDPGVAEEDAAVLEDGARPPANDARAIDVAAVRFPRISNFDDLDALAAEPDVRLRWVTDPAGLGQPDLIVLPGTKATAADLGWLRTSGLAGAVADAVAAGSAVIGICGGYQMLGTAIRDPHGVESRAPWTDGLGLLNVQTEFATDKRTARVEGMLPARSPLAGTERDIPVHGYEIHMGRTVRHGEASLLRLCSRSGMACDDEDGAVRSDGRVAGTYLHGLFENTPLRSALLTTLARRRGRRFRPGVPLDRDAAYDRLADCLRAALDLNLIRRAAGLETPMWTG